MILSLSSLVVMTPFSYSTICIWECLFCKYTLKYQFSTIVSLILLCWGFSYQSFFCVLASLSLISKVCHSLLTAEFLLRFSSFLTHYVERDKIVYIHYSSLTCTTIQIQMRKKNKLNSPPPCFKYKKEEVNIKMGILSKIRKVLQAWKELLLLY